ncbi:MAG: dipeptidase PepE [Acidobacteria bacterium]|nr:dipeptidase PepE [Acidobacteriota bacterium]
MNIALFSKALANDGTVIPFVRDELRALYHDKIEILVVTAAGNNSAEAVRRASALMTTAGVTPVLLHQQRRPLAAIAHAAAFYICGGNVFRLAHSLQTLGWMDPIRAQVEAGAPYAGTSAGAVIAGPSIATTNSMPVVLPPRLDALGLVHVHVNAHYPTDSEDGLGETRETRIQEVIYERLTDVLALRDGSGLRTEHDTAMVIGQANARFFPWDGRSPCELSPGSSIPPITEWSCLG